MDVPIKMIDFATAICWVILIVFSASAVYSVKDLEFNSGEPQIGATSDGRILLSLPINISNNGYYDIGLFNFTTSVQDQKGSTIAQGSTLIPTIRRGEKLLFLHNMTIDANSMLQLNQKYLFNDTQLSATESVSMKLGELIPVQASGNFTIPWGAPLYNLKLGEVQYNTFNLTYTRVIVPLSFDNHASIDIKGEAQILLYNGANQPIGLGRTEVEAAQHSHYDGQVELYVATSSITPTERFELEFQTPLFNYGPAVTPYD
jgi:hypothetical protein